MIRVSLSELKGRLKKIGEIIVNKNLGGIYISNATTFKYIADYFYIPTERPAAFFIDRDLQLHFFGPELEKEHVLTQSPLIKDSYGYPDYPGVKHPLALFSDWISELSRGKRIGTDNKSLYGGVWGFKGLPPEEILKGFEMIDVSQEIYNFRKIKSNEEIELMRESSKWGNLAHRLLQEYTEPDRFDFEISSIASTEACVAAMNAFGMDVVPPINYPISIGAGFRGQVGEHTYFPHSLTVNRKIKMGDMLGSGASGNIDGYHIEIERNLFVGTPTDEMRKYHGLAVEMQQVAIDSLELGKPFSKVDEKVMDFAKRKDVLKYRLHHSGHCIGLEGHESPFLDIGESEELQENMVFSVEPGIYVPKLGGFRHSDTVVMHKNGPEVITYYPKETDDLTVWL